MNIQKIFLIVLFFTVFIPAVFSDYSISWYTIDGGGGTSFGGAYQLAGTIGQPDPGYHYNKTYELLGGFWAGGPLCIIDFQGFAAFAAYWLDGPCNQENNWCQGADLNQINDVDIVDLSILASEWLNFCPFNWPLN